MSYKVTCRDLQVAGCNETFEGETAGDVVDQVREHLGSEHHIEVPETDIVLMTGVAPDVETFTDVIMEGGYDADTIQIVRRLRDKLNVTTEEDRRT